MRPYRKHESNPLTAAQRTIIKMAQQELGISDDDYRSMLEERYGVRSCTSLTVKQAEYFIDELGRKGFTVKAKPKPAKRTASKTQADAKTFLPRDRYRKHGRGNGKIITLATPQEIEKINKLAALITWKFENGVTLFLEKRMGLKEGKVRTSVDAEKAIEGLKSYVKSDMKRKHGEDWWLKRFEDPEVMRFIAEHAPAEYR